MAGGLIDTIIEAMNDREATKRGYDPKNPISLVQMLTDYSDAADPGIANGPAYGFGGMTIGQIDAAYNNKNVLESLIKHYSARFNKPLKGQDK